MEGTAAGRPSSIPGTRWMDVEKSSLCNCVVDFLLRENYLLTAFELLHELAEDGRNDQTIRLRQFFADTSLFPPDQLARFSTLQVADPQSLLEEKEILEEKLAVSEYELRLAQEDLLKVKDELRRKSQLLSADSDGHVETSQNDGLAGRWEKRVGSFDLGPLKDAVRRDLNCAVKDYLFLAGYRLTAMTFYEEVTDQNLDIWPNSAACVKDALRRYYYQYLSSTAEAAEEKISILREKDKLLQETERLAVENESLKKSKDLADSHLISLRKLLESTQRELKDKEILVQDLKQSLELQRKELNECRAEITSLKMHIESARVSQRMASGRNDEVHSMYINNHNDEVNTSQILGMDSKRNNGSADTSKEPVRAQSDDALDEEKTPMLHEDSSPQIVSASISSDVDNDCRKDNHVVDAELLTSSCHGGISAKKDKINNVEQPRPSSEDRPSFLRSDSSIEQKISEKSVSTLHDTQRAIFDKSGAETIQILADALPKIVPYVLINHREELLPLIMCAIERHPESSVRDSLTHTLFNLIKRPDEQQRRIIMDACVMLAKSVGEMRTETELLPQCWEQINHVYEERRLLVAQSCGELAMFVRPEIRDSLILSIIQQLVEDSAAVVRQAAAHNLALLLPCFPNMDKYFKVEDLVFQLVCDPSGSVVETSLKELLPVMINWGKKLDHVLRVLFSHLLGSAQRCPPLSGVEGSVDSHLHVLGERERWNVDVLLRMLIELLPFIHKKAIETCPFTLSIESFSNSEAEKCFFSISIFELYLGGHAEWPAFDWLHIDCFPNLIQLACLLPTREDNLRTHMTKFLLAVSEAFGEQYVTHIMLPVFFIAVGDNVDLASFPTNSQSRIKGLQPRTAVSERLAVMCVLPLLLAGILGSPSRCEQLAEFLRRLLVQNTVKEGSRSYHLADLIHAVRFLCMFEVHHGIIFNILWEMVVSSNVSMKINAANLLKVLVPYVDVKVASTHVLPALVTLGSDQNLNVKYASIDAFGAVAQHFKNDTIVEKIRIQMDAFLEDGSHEATIAVVRALVIAVPHTTEKLRDYLLSKIFQLSNLPVHGSDVMRRRERANAFCESIRALDATDLPSTSVRDLLLPTIQNMLKDNESLDPAHKEALEVILRERSGGTLEAISKVMGAHLGIASSMSSFFGEGGLLGKKEGAEPQEVNVSPRQNPPVVQEDTRFRRIMRGNFGDMLRVKGKGQEDVS